MRDCIAKWRELGDISLGLFMCICFTSLYIGLDLVSFVLFCFGWFCFDFFVFDFGFVDFVLSYPYCACCCQLT